MSFFMPVLADGLSLEFKWQQASSGLQDFSQYSCQFFSISFPNFCKLFLVYKVQLVSPSLSHITTFSVLWEDPSTCLSFPFIGFSFFGQLEQQNPLDGKFFFYIIIINPYKAWTTGLDWGIHSYLKIPENLIS